MVCLSTSTSLASETTGSFASLTVEGDSRCSPDSRAAPVGLNDNGKNWCVSQIGHGKRPGRRNQIQSTHYLSFTLSKLQRVPQTAIMPFGPHPTLQDRPIIRPASAKRFPFLVSNDWSYSDRVNFRGGFVKSDPWPLKSSWKEGRI